MKKIFTIVLILTSIFSYSQEMDITKDTAKIEQEYLKNIDKATGDIEMALVVGNTIEAYDKLLNKYYTACLKKIPVDKKQILINAQRSWLSFRDNEKKLIELKYSGGPGANISMISEDVLKLYRQRVIELYDYLGFLF